MSKSRSIRAFAQILMGFAFQGPAIGKSKKTPSELRERRVKQYREDHGKHFVRRFVN